MPKALCIIALSISILLFILFGLDLIAGIPFGKADMKMDLGFLVCSGVLGALSFLSLRQQK
ncbi:MAG: hypothetical protein Q4G68_09660 [Planctomycetia bacterium]|nr:hypothetical protein [Planctomycetia bacterium]